jgi:hypothetical protein
MRPERRARSGVDGGLQVASAQLKPYTLPTPDGEEAILRNVDIARIQDERSRECIRLLLNLIESLTVDLRKSQAENLYLREQLNRRKGGAGKPDQPKDTAGPKPQSSEKERAETRQRTRRGKLERVRIDREEVLRLDRTSLPPDAQFKGYDDVVVQELRIGTDNVKFRKEKYYAPSTGQTYLASLPAGYRGEFGPNLKSMCLLCSHLCNMTEPKIADLLENFGIAISSGQIPAWLTGAYPGIQEEKQAIVEAGLTSSLTVPLYGGLSAGQHMDDTGTRVNGEKPPLPDSVQPTVRGLFHHRAQRPADHYRRAAQRTPAGIPHQ